MQLVDDGSEYIGPYTGSFAVRQTVDEVKKIFRLPQCTKTFPVTHRQRPCLNFHISQCSAPCAGKISQADYKRSVEQAVEFLKGGSAETVKRMQAEMEQAAENLDFEKAAVLRDRINAITKFGEKQKVVSADVAEQDVFALAQSQDKACLAVLRFFAGRLCDTEHFIIDAPEDDAVARYELIMSYYSMRERIPPRILIDSLPQDAELISQWLSEKLGKKVSFVVPQRGGQLKLLEMCRSNASEKLALSLGRKGKDTAALDELARLLGLDSPPEYIESYDISHTAGTENVAGMVVFKNGQPYKQAYKRFKIKGFEGQDDCASMAEVLERRFTHYFEENAKPEGEKRDEGFAKLPDLILLDGAEMQVNAVRAVFLRLGIDVPLYGMVKDSSHRTRAITCEGGEISINSKRSAFTLVSRIQEEVHRFAIEYHRKRRSAGISTTLTQIEGVGQKRAAALLKHFKSVNAVKEASFDELCSVKGVDKRSAQTVFDYFHSDKG